MPLLPNTRAVACILIDNILKQKSTLASLDQSLKAYELTVQGRKFVYLLCYGFFRHYFYLNRCAEILIHGRTKPKVKVLLLIGIYQLLFTDKAKKAPHAVINETVSACDALKIYGAKAFINATLRRLEQATLPKLNTVAELPGWLIDKLKQQGQNVVEIIRESNLQAPVFLRLNRQKAIGDPLAGCTTKEVAYQAMELSDCIRLQGAYHVTDLPGFDAGLFSVQDLSAQYAAHILNPQSGEHILDACAAPGGKSTHLLELCPAISLTIADNSQKRFARIHENIRRLGQAQLKLRFLHQDLTQPFSVAFQFDKILLDAPCSASGVIRRNPDIKLLRTPEEIANIVQIQQKILNNLWSYLKPGGILLYVTCSILAEENEKQVAGFLAAHPDASVSEIPLLPKKSRQSLGYQILPKHDLGDGFYYSRLQKQR